MHFIYIHFTTLYLYLHTRFDIADSIQQMLRMQAACNVTMKDMQQRIVQLQSAVKHRALSPVHIYDNLIMPFLPLSTIEVMKEFDALLKTSDEAVAQFVSINIVSRWAY